MARTKRIRVIKSDFKASDRLRVNDLAQQYHLPFKKVGSIYRFEDFNAYGLDQALGFVEGYDRAARDFNAMAEKKDG
jgi:hypothetical protein